MLDFRFVYLWRGFSDLGSLCARLVRLLDLDGVRFFSRLNDMLCGLDGRYRLRMIFMNDCVMIVVLIPLCFRDRGLRC